MDKQATVSKVTFAPTVNTAATAAIPSSDKQQKPSTTLLIGPSPFYRNVSGRLSLNDRHLQHNLNRTAGTSDSNSWSQAAPWRPASSSNGPVLTILRRVANSNPTTPISTASALPFYTKPHPFILSTSSQLRASPSGIGFALQRPHSVAASPTAPGAGLAPYSPWGSADSVGLQTGPRRPRSIASSPVSSRVPDPLSARPRDGPVALSSYGVLHQPIPRRPHSITISAAITPQAPSEPTTRTGNSPQQQGPRRSFIPSSTSVPILPSATSSPIEKPVGPIEQPTPCPHSMLVTATSSATLSHTAITAYSCVPVITTGSSHTWSSSSGPHRRVATTSGTPILNSSQATHSTAVRRLSLPSTSAQVALGLQTPKPSPTFHGVPFLPVRPLSCGFSPNGNPIFLGCTHLHNPNSKSNTPATTPSKTVASTAQVLQQLLLQHPRNGFRSLDEKVNLFLEILDTQERFEQVRHLSSCSSWIVVTLHRSLLPTVSIVCCVACGAEWFSGR